MPTKTIPNTGTLHRGFSDVHTPPAFAYELCMSAETELEQLSERRKSLCTIVQGDGYTPHEKHQAAQQLSAIAKRRSKVMRHVEASTSRDSLLIKRMRVLLTPEQFERCCTLSALDHKHVLSTTSAWSSDD